MKLNRKNKKGFTIVELVIVIAVIGILAAILIPTFTNLTKNAQESAKKQTVGDGYVVYLAEAVDNKVDDVFTRSGTGQPADPYVYTEAKIAIANKKQGEVVALYNGEYFLYNQEKGWENKGTTAPDNVGNLVVNHYKASAIPEEAVPVDQALYSGEAGHAVRFDFMNEQKTATISELEANKKLSTFNTVIFYTITGAAA